MPERMELLEDFVKQVGRNIRRGRRIRGISTYEAADRADMTLEMWRKIEDGELELDIDLLIQICAVLEMDAVELLEPPPRRSRHRPPRKSSASGWRTTSIVSGVRRSLRLSKPPMRRRSTSGTGEE
jgi:ribosome-binding protein aMBF1 (putative translation factor)